jgi:hypothetical protein
MAARIDSAEVVSFRLKVPRLELERLCQTEAGRELELELHDEEGVLHLGPAHADSFLRFRTTGAEAVLAEVYLCRDPDGAFLLRVLGPLMVRFAGDLSLRLTWNVPERNAAREFVELDVARGMTDFPGLGHVPTTPDEARAGAGAGAAVRNELRAGGEELADPLPAEEAEEIRRLLDEGRAHYEEYLRLKRQGDR